MENKCQEAYNRLSTEYSISNDFTEDINDPIAAYFNKRCRNSTKEYLNKRNDSDSGSSIGVLDVENLSYFGKEVENENESSFLNNSVHSINLKSQKRISDTRRYGEPEDSLNIEKQRSLAHEVLTNIQKIEKTHDFNNKEILQPKRQSSILKDISSKVINPKTPINQEERNWFTQNLSPNTPRYFNDELSSLGESNTSTSSKGLIQSSSYSEKMGSLHKQFNNINITDLEFESLSKEDQINKLEEDERKFKAENSALSHNSRISQFSGVGGEVAFWDPDSQNWNDSKSANKKVSIGQFFNMRSDRISSLMGSSCTNPKSPNQIDDTLMPDESVISKHELSLQPCVTPKANKTKLRRCFSNYDLPTTDIVRCSSGSSNSTLIIQNILTEMESGLSGTQMYEKLIKSYGTKKLSSNEKAKKITKEPKTSACTPKSSNILNKKKELVESCNKSKNVKALHNQDTMTLHSEDSKENEPTCLQKINFDQSVIPKSKGKSKRLSNLRSFEASTPLKPKNERKVKKEIEPDIGDWEIPKLSLIYSPKVSNKTVISDDNDKTIMNSNSTALKNTTITLEDTLNIEDTIVAGDLSLLSQRIEEMKSDGVCIVRSDNPQEPVLLSVVQKLADLPKGSVDCSSLTPLIRDQFPELLSTFPTEDNFVFPTELSDTPHRKNTVLVHRPGSWIKTPLEMGFSRKIKVCVEGVKKIFIPIENITQKWVLISIENLCLLHPLGKKLDGVKELDTWNITDFLYVTMKDTLLPPNCRRSLMVSITPVIAAVTDLKFGFVIREVLGTETQSRYIHVRINNINPIKNVNIIPSNGIDFGVIGNLCSAQKTVKIVYDGVCELPFTLSLVGDNSNEQYFYFKSVSAPKDTLKTWTDQIFHGYFHEGDKQIVEFEVGLNLENLPLNSDNPIKKLNTTLSLKISQAERSDGKLLVVPIKATVGLMKFVANYGSEPILFRASGKGLPMTKSIYLKNIGLLPIEFTASVLKANSYTDQEDRFEVPKSIYLPKNDVCEIPITFTAKTNDPCVKGTLLLTVNPSSGASYDFNLIGILKINEGRPSSRASNDSVSTKSIGNNEGIRLKILTSSPALSWPGVLLEKEVRKTFQIKLGPGIPPTTVRISFKKNTDSFKLVNENGEKVEKIRKALKPDCPFALTVAFRPDLPGPHHNALFMETNETTGKKMVFLQGTGGLPNIFLGNVKSDLNGCKMLFLQNTESNPHCYTNVLEFKNKGKSSGFILIKNNLEAVCLSQTLTCSPSNFVMTVDSNVSVKISQKLKSDDIRALLRGKDICKVASLTVLIGDEMSRLRLRKLLVSGKIKPSERVKLLTDKFDGEKEVNLKNFIDFPSFEVEFFKSLSQIDIAVVIEKSSGIGDHTIFVDEDSVDDFVSVYSAVDNTVISGKEWRNRKSLKANSDETDSIFSLSSVSPQKNVAKWLETLECTP